jgi:hypothetical protein
MAHPLGANATQGACLWQASDFAGGHIGANIQTAASPHDSAACYALIRERAELVLRRSVGSKSINRAYLVALWKRFNAAPCSLLVLT